MDTLIWVEEERLPGELRALFDPARPIGQDVVFFADATAFWKRLAAWCLLGAGLFFAAVAAVWGWELRHLGELRGGLDVAVMLGAEAGWCAATWALLRAWRRLRRDARDIETGRWRFGLFLTADALVVRHPRACAAVPRALVASAGIRERRTSNGTRLRDLEVAFWCPPGTARPSLPAGGEPYRVSLPSPDARPSVSRARIHLALAGESRLERLVETIERWRRG